jgi:predicted cupin superfamily sugar epimerase
VSSPPHPRLQSILDVLQLAPHPEGGFFVETWRDPTPPRGVGTAIYYAMDGGRWQRWHRVDAVEIWHHYAGAPVDLELVDASGVRRIIRLGSDLEAGQRPQHVIPAGEWQRARSTGDWSLCGCTVSPAFDFAGFELVEGDDPPV